MRAREVGASPLGDVTEHEHCANRGPSLVSNRRSAVVDGMLFSGSSDEHRMVGQPDRRAALQSTHGRVVHRLSRSFVDDLEDVWQQVAERVRLRPAGQRFCDRVHECHAAVGIGRDDGVADARQCRAEPFRLLPQMRLRRGVAPPECSERFVGQQREAVRPRPRRMPSTTPGVVRSPSPSPRRARESSQTRSPGSWSCRHRRGRTRNRRTCPVAPAECTRPPATLARRPPRRVSMRGSIGSITPTNTHLVGLEMIADDSEDADRILLSSQRDEEGPGHELKEARKQRRIVHVGTVRRIEVAAWAVCTPIRRRSSAENRESARLLRSMKRWSNSPTGPA